MEVAGKSWRPDESHRVDPQTTGGPDAGLLGAASRPVLLLADDEPGVLDVLERLATTVGFEVVACANGTDAIAAMRARPADLALVDLRMPDLSGLDVLRQFRVDAPNCDVLLMTGFAAVDSAVEAIKLGARDYMAKPFDFDRLRRLLEEFREAFDRRSTFDARPRVARPDLVGMLGESPVIRDVFDLVRKLAPHAKTVLISGETGTGKELVARAFHQFGPRHGKPFVTINCSALTDVLSERDLFGCEAGTYPGAARSQSGLLEAADGGTVFLDEVGELPLGLQAKLLRVIECGEIQRPGAYQPRVLDLTVVAATNGDLKAEVAAGRFRADLYYRLNVVGVALPPLRERREDIPLLASGFMRELAVRLQKTLTGFTADAQARLQRAPWEGNVRELRNCVERACMLADGPVVMGTDVDRALAQGRVVLAADGSAGLHVVRAGVASAPLQDVEREHIQHVLRDVGGNRVAAARVLGISRRTLYRRLERHRLDRA